MAFVRVNDLQIHTQVIGEGAPVVMIHGLLLGSIATWYFGAANELAKSHQVIMYDLRSHGKSERSADGYDLVTLASDLDGLLNHYQARSVSLVGHSYGGLIALYYAVKNQSRVEKLGLVDVPLPTTLMSGFFDEKIPKGDELLALLPPQLQEAFKQKRRQATKLFDSLKFLYTESSLIEDVRKADIDDADLRSLDIETLCIFGKDSPCRPAADRLKATLPNVRLALVFGGHQVPMEASGEMTHHLKGFL